jgi:hypothetical protein
MIERRKDKPFDFWALDALIEEQNKDKPDNETPKLVENFVYMGDDGYYMGEGIDNHNPKREGTGYWIEKSGDCIYEGQWKDDRKDGYGRIIHKNGKTYQGKWKRDKFNG